MALLVLRMSASSFLPLRTELSPGQHATGNMELILLTQNFNHLYLVPASPSPEFHRFLLSSLLAMSRFIRTQCCKETSFLCVCAPANSLLNTQQTFLAKTFPALLNQLQFLLFSPPVLLTVDLVPSSCFLFFSLGTFSLTF